MTSGYLRGTVNQVLPGTGTYGEYSAVANPSQQVSIPFWFNAVDGWTSGMAIQNVNDTTISVIVDFWPPFGDNTFYPLIIGPHQTELLVNHPVDKYNGYVPFSFSGTATIWASAPVAVISNSSRSGASDGLLSFSGAHK